MKIIKVLLLIITTLIVSQSVAQDSLHTVLSYYPLNKGNIWEYRASVEDFTDPPQYSESFYRIMIIGDTVLANGIKYKILERRKIPDNNIPIYYFERVDSSTANIFRYNDQHSFPNDEYLIDSLMSNTGDTSKSSRLEITFDDAQTECTNIATLSILGMETLVKSFIDHSLIHGSEYYLAKDLGYIGSSGCHMSCYVTNLVYASINGIEYGEKVSHFRDDKIRLEYSYHLYQNYPNPFNPNTTFSFYVPVKSRVNISLFDITGRFVEEIVSSIYPKGYHTIEFTATNLATGLYLYVLNSNTTSISRKLILMK